MKVFAFILSTLFALHGLAATVDLKQSEVTWKGSKVIGSTHTGNVQLESAKVQYKGGEPVSAAIVIDMNSITNSDVKDPKWNKKLIGHLKSDDFFATGKHKTSQLTVSKIQKASDKFYLLHGKLKIKGKEMPIKVKAQVVKDEKKNQVVQTRFTFDRTKFGIKYGSGSFFTGLGDKMISDEVEITVKLAIKK